MPSTTGLWRCHEQTRVAFREQAQLAARGTHPLLVHPSVHRRMLEARIVEKTGWDYQMLRRQPRGWLEQIVTCWQADAAAGNTPRQDET